MGLSTPANPAGERGSDAALTPRPGTRSIFPSPSLSRGIAAASFLSARSRDHGGACATILKAAFDGTVQFNTLSNGPIVTVSKKMGNCSWWITSVRMLTASRSRTKSTSSPQILLRDAISRGSLAVGRRLGNEPRRDCGHRRSSRPKQQLRGRELLGLHHH
jgi:hypothetical protein